MTVKTIIEALKIIRGAYNECCWELQRVRDKISRLEKENKPVDISLKTEEEQLSDRLYQISAVTDEILGAEIK